MVHCISLGLDLQLREIYNRSEIVVVPIKNVYQPSGYSVVLQAMASGCAVILTDFKGLWDRDLFLNYQNCILVPPYNSNSISVAIKKLQENDELRRKYQLMQRKLQKSISLLIEWINHFKILYV